MTSQDAEWGCFIMRPFYPDARGKGFEGCVPYPSVPCGSLCGREVLFYLKEPDSGTLDTMEASTWFVCFLWTMGLFVFDCDAHYSKDRSKSFGPSIVCYECNSAYDPRCGDPFNPYTIGTVNCSLKGQLAHLPDLKPKLCRKTVQVVQGIRRVIRGCGYITHPRDDKQCHLRTGTKEVEIRYCACTKSLCNASPYIHSSPAGVIPLLVMVVVAISVLRIWRVA